MNQTVGSASSPAAEFLAMMASHYDSGLILCCGDSLYDYCLQISKAMSMTTKLVLNVETEQGLKNSQPLTSKDIRIAVHKQDYLSFLDDISRYFFNLILLEDNTNLEAMIQGLLDKLMPGGLIVVLNGNTVLLENYLPEGWHIVESRWPDNAVFIRAKSQTAQPTQRKGGRRARIIANRIE